MVGAAALLSACSAPTPAPAPAPAPTSPSSTQPVPPSGRVPTAKVEPPAAPVPTPVPAPVAATPSNQFKVKTDRTPFYVYGPQQPGGPNSSLERGTVVTLIKRGFGYSQVRLRTEQTGYVGTEDLVALTPEELLAQEQPEAPLTGDLGPLPRPGGVRRSTLPPATPVDLPVEMPMSTDPIPAPPDKPEAKPSATPSSNAAGQ